jgi:hypothetical protein
MVAGFVSTPAQEMIDESLSEEFGNQNFLIAALSFAHVFIVRV